ncbi:ABC transporter permease [Paraburkholderia sp.]|uniref:ABC transporter permease n=1 Tax=Paraburkholderia sp. TaxID=1926495 RepID=UPI00239D8EEB|nr:ABC transporter permease [Paraburkholderia sp.]MDE1180832.1 ABC transporter permease [Paraburkholderia sp.]
MFSSSIRRLGATALALLVVSLCVFTATQVLPGDAAQAILGRDATPERLAALRMQLHLDGSPLSQYGAWLWHAVHADFGVSLSNGMAVNLMLGERVGNSLLLMGASISIGVPLALITGAASGYWRDSAFDHAATIVTLVLSALPEVVLAMGLIILLATGLFPLFPATATMRPVTAYPLQLVLPALTLGLAIVPYIVRMVRAAMIEVMDSDYVAYARLTGLPERTVVFRHGLVNMLGAVAQVLALQLAYLAGGVVMVEYVFGYPGIGSAMIDAVNNRDLPVVQAIALLIAIVYIVVNLIADSLTLLANPRVRHAAR